jgi:drug/metabolite transporter (DMT)-like permease
MFQKENIKWFYLVLLALIWGSSFILMKHALKGFSPLQVGSLRIVFTSVIILIWGFKRLKNIQVRHWKAIALIAVFATMIPALLFPMAIKHVDSSITAVINAVTPLNTVIIGFLIFGFTFRKDQILGVIIGFLGTVSLILIGADTHPNQNYYYAIFVVISSLGYALNVNLIKSKLYDLDPLSITVGPFALVLLPMLFVLWYSGFYDTYQGTTVQNNALIYLGILALVGTAISKVIFNKLVQISSPVFATSVTYLIPIVALIWGMWDGEQLVFGQFIAGAVILFGVFLANRKR